MSSIIGVNVTSRTNGGENFITNLFRGTKNKTIYNPAVEFGFDTHDIITPIRNDGSKTYFSTREWTRMDVSSRKDAQISWTSSDALAAISAKSNDLVLLTVLFRDAIRQVDMQSETMIFVASKMMTGMGLIVDPVSGGTIFQYVEEGNPDPMQYTVAETIDQIAAAGSGPVYNMNGYDLYVNNLVGNDATAEKGNPILPWATMDAALAAAVSGDTIVYTNGGPGDTAVTNGYKAGVNIRIEGGSSLDFNGYVASGMGNQTIYGEGIIFANGMTLNSTFDGNITINVNTINGGTNSFLNQSTNGAILNVECSYFYQNRSGSPQVTAYSVTGNGSGNFIIKSKFITFGASVASSFIYINPTSTSTSKKNFKFYIGSGDISCIKQGLLCVSNTDATYFIDATLNVNFINQSGTTGILTSLNSLLVAISNTGGIININGLNYVSDPCNYALILNSAITINDYSNSYGSTSVPEIILAGGTSKYTLYGKKLTLSNAESISLGKTFTAANASTNFGTPTATAGTDTLHFKGGLKCTYANNAAIGILVDNANPNLIIDGGTIEMVNSNTANVAISGSTQNYKILGTGFVRGAISGMTNTITGSNIIQDPGVVAGI